MKQVILIGNFNRWETEAEFICEMLQMTATRVILINIGRGEAPADLNAKELRQLFPGKTLEDCVHLAISKLYLQGIADGILVLLGKEPHYYALADKAFAAMPFGLPKAAILSGDCTWQGRRDILHIYLPGTGYNMNPVIKILLCNTAFAISGMCLCSIHNFGSSAPTVAQWASGKQEIFCRGRPHHIAFFDNDPMLPPLLRNGYIHGLMLASGQNSVCPALTSPPPGNPRGHHQQEPLGQLGHSGLSPCNFRPGDYYQLPSPGDSKHGLPGSFTSLGALPFDFLQIWQRQFLPLCRKDFG